MYISAIILSIGKILDTSKSVIKNKSISKVIIFDDLNAFMVKIVIIIRAMIEEMTAGSRRESTTW